MTIIQKVLLILSIVISAATSFGYAAVNLNTASQAELEALPGVGKKMAEAIIARRPYKNVEELKEIKGVGDKNFEKLKPLMMVDSGTPSAATVQAGQPPTTLKKSDRMVKKEEAKAATTLAPGEKVSLNTGSLEQLEKLPGIGPVKAQAIISARPFKSIEDIKKVTGIKEKMFTKIKDSITL